MQPHEAANLALVRDYLSALERGATGPALGRFFSSDAVQREFPNRLNPHGAESDLKALLERAERGGEVVASQEYRVRSAMARGDTVAVEAEWVATLAVPVGGIPAGR